ncbi:hypothetical protein ACQ4PT_016783 [Festuca glaucescens]
MEQSRGSSSRLRFLLAVLLFELVSAAAAITRDDFPEGFVFGAGSSAYQEDVRLMHEMGLDAYRFSISWSRLIPDGRGAVNPKGLEYYNNLIDELLKHGIQPHTTIYHFDLPQALQDEYNGLLNPRVIEDFTAFADVCFRSFGDRVKQWTTVNEPNIEPLGGYDMGYLPPRRCSSPFGFPGITCAEGNSTMEPYVVAHHLLFAHASMVSLYRRKYQAVQGGRIGITLLAWWYEPATTKPEDVAAAERMNDFTLGWFLHPLVYGDYPPVMKRNAGSKLPALTAEESARVRGSFDFVGVNQYGAIYVADDPSQLKRELRDYSADEATKYVTQPFESSRHQLGQEFKQRGLGLRNDDAPWALRKLLEHLQTKYANPPVVIYENGAGHEPDPSGGLLYDDEFRSRFLQVYIEAALQSIRNGSNVRSYFVWSFMDVFEYIFAYQFQFGLIGVDYGAEGRTRYARSSARWYAGFLHGGELRMVAPDGSRASS